MDPSRPRFALWQRYALSLVVAVVLLTGLVVWVSGHNTNSNPETNPAAAVRANREAEILVAQDQTPRAARLAAGLSPVAGLERVIRAHVARAVAAGSISGPLKRVRCRPTGAGNGARRGYSCTVESGSVVYPFLAVVDSPARRIIYCKRDPPPVPSDNVPVSPRCRS